MVFAMPVVSVAATGWYAGAGGGRSSFDGNEADIESTIATETYTLTRFDDDGTGWKVFAGRQFTENLAVELAYTDLGKFSFDADINPGTFGAGTEHAEVKPKCWSLSAVGILPVGNNFSLLGKAGVCRWNDHYRGYESVGGMEYEYEPSSTGTDLTFGLGAKYDFTDNLGVRAEWERFNNIVHGDTHVDLWSLSFQYDF